MAVNRIRATNFKSFQNLDVSLGKLNVLVGANASGKSNFIQIFRFLRDIAEHGPRDAVSLQSGIEYLRNITVAARDKVSIEITNSYQSSWLPSRGIRPTVYEMIYRFAIDFPKTGTAFTVSEDRLTFKLRFAKVEENGDKKPTTTDMGSGETSIANVNGKLVFTPTLPDGVTPDDLFPIFMLRHLNLPSKDFGLLRAPLPIWPEPRSVFSDVAIYDFDPRSSKRAVKIAGKAQLEEDGSNLAIVLRNIKANNESRRKFFNLVNDLLPFIDNFDVDTFPDKSLLFKLRERYFKKQYLPASLISDGTINIMCMIAALYFEQRDPIIIEEPERNIHPYLISRVVDMMKDASRRKQIIVTTQNPELVKHAGLENLFLVSRDEQGFSNIVRPADSEPIKTFLLNEMGLDELYVQNLLELQQ